MIYGLNDHFHGRQDYSDVDDVFWMLVQNAPVKKCWTWLTKTFRHQHFKLVTIGGSTMYLFPNIRYPQWCPISMTLYISQYLLGLTFGISVDSFSEIFLYLTIPDKNMSNHFLIK